MLGLAAPVVYSSTAARSGHVSRVIRRGRQLQQRMEKEQALEALRSRDPDFDEDHFCNRTNIAFAKIQDAWSNQEQAAVRAFVSDGIHERFSLQYEMQKAEGYRNHMEDVRVLNTTIAGVYADEHFDTIHVAIRASAVDYNVDLETGRRRDGSTRAEEFLEYWSFHRKPGAKTLARPGSIEGNCPNCAAPLSIVDQAKCSACGSTVNSGEHDWVLAEITQSSEWRVPDDDRRVPGLSEIKQSDRGFSVQHVEDRVSVMFWRLQAAQFFDNSDYATPVLSENMAREFDRHGKSRSQSMQFWKDPAVGKVELIDVTLGEADGTDRIRVMLRWSGQLCERTDNGKSRLLRGQSIYTHVYGLVRQHGVQSIASRSFSSAGCTQCGAPIAVSKEATCGYCGAQLADGRYDWVLDSVGPYTPELAYRTEFNEASDPTGPQQRYGPAGNGEPERQDHELSLAVLARLMTADGQLHEKEQRALVKLGRRRGLSKNQILAIVNGNNGSEFDLPVPTDARQAQQYLHQLVRASLVDGNISRAEKRFLATYARKADMSAADVKLAIARERRRAYQRARAVLKGQPPPTL